VKAQRDLFAPKPQTTAVVAKPEASQSTPRLPGWLGAPDSPWTPAQPPYRVRFARCSRGPRTLSVYAEAVCSNGTIATIRGYADEDGLEWVVPYEFVTRMEG